MIVTLDDVFTLFDLSIVGQLCLNEVLDFEATLKTLMDLLGVDRMRSTFELRESHGPKVRLT